MPKFLRSALTALCLLGLASPALAQGGPAAVQTDTVTTIETAETIAVFGEVVSGRDSSVAARVAGVATDVPVRVGDRVAQGDLLAQIDTELLRIGVDQARAEITIAEAGISSVEARLERADKALRRAESLRANSTIAEAQLEDRTSDYAEALGARTEALARVDAARTALRRAEYDLENAAIRAPFDGVILSVETELGQFVATGSEVARMVDTGAMEVEANVPARFVPALSEGLAVEAQTDAGGAMNLSLRTALPTEFAATRTRPVRFNIVEAQSEPAIGQSVTLEVPVSAPREVAAVPKDALIQARGGWSVYVAVEGKAQPRTVEIGDALGDRFEVLSGLSAGDEVVVRGNERLRPGQEIAAQPVAPPAGASGGQQGGEQGGEAAAPQADPQSGANDDEGARREAAIGQRG